MVPEVCDIIVIANSIFYLFSKKPLRAKAPMRALARKYAA
jgi:hypothetical protein